MAAGGGRPGGSEQCPPTSCAVTATASSAASSSSARMLARAEARAEWAGGEGGVWRGGRARKLVFERPCSALNSTRTASGRAGAGARGDSDSAAALGRRARWATRRPHSPSLSHFKPDARASRRLPDETLQTETVLRAGRQRASPPQRHHGRPPACASRGAKQRADGRKGYGPVMNGGWVGCAGSIAGRDTGLHRVYFWVVWGSTRGHAATPAAGAVSLAALPTTEPNLMRPSACAFLHVMKLSRPA